jgi:hypothetical protein
MTRKAMVIDENLKQRRGIDINFLTSWVYQCMEQRIEILILISFVHSLMHLLACVVGYVDRNDNNKACFILNTFSLSLLVQFVWL